LSADKIEVYISKSGRNAVLSAALGTAAEGMRKMPSGKPYIPGGREFNISHSGDITVCAVSNSPVGVDIEIIKPRNISRLMRILTPRERKALEALNGEEKLREFYRIWTVKEAVCKLSGNGISRARIEEIDSYSPGFFVQSHVPGEYVLSLCAEKEAQVEIYDI